MLTVQDLCGFPTPGADAPVFLVYSARPSARLEYCLHFIFHQVLNVNYTLTDDRQAFEQAVANKINYSEAEIPGTVQIIPHVLLFETGISSKVPEPFVRNAKLYFFENKMGEVEKGLHFDLFSAVFYFISRYEEWQVFEKDAHLRFEAKASLLFRNGFHLKPVVDQWIREFQTFLQEEFGVIFPPPSFKISSSIDVDNLFAYRFKGFARTVGAGLKDLLKRDLKNLAWRIRVIRGQARDPFDIYEEVSEFCSAQQIPLIWFFLFRNGTRHDRTVNPFSKAFKQVIAALKKKAVGLGLHPSYNAAFRPGLLAEEADNFSSLLGEQVKQSRQHFLRFDIRSTPALLLKNGITADYSMGFASAPGFRAGTAYPFFYYDLSLEKKSELIFVPFCAMDGVYMIYQRLPPEDALNSMLQLCSEIKKTGGLFMTVFHERTFSDHLYPGFGSLYKNLHLRVKTV